MAGSRGRRASGRVIEVKPVRVVLNGEEAVWAVTVRMDLSPFTAGEGHLLQRLDCATNNAMNLGRILMHTLHPDCHEFRMAKRKEKDSIFSQILFLPDEDCRCAHPGRG